MGTEKIKRGDIYMAYLDPVVGSEQGGTRPVLIIQNNTGNRFASTVIVSIITTKKKGNQPTHVELGTLYGLAHESVLSAEQPRTLDKSRLLHYIGHVDAAKMREVNRALAVSLGLFNGKPPPEPDIIPALLQKEQGRITLCPTCASAEYNSGKNVIRRIDRCQSSKARCCICNSKYGFDYWLTDKTKSKPAKGGTLNGNQRLSPR